MFAGTENAALLTCDVSSNRSSRGHFLVAEEQGFRGHPDLVDRERRLVMEAESFDFHGRRRALKHDCERYTGLVVRGWTVVRFAWAHGTNEQDYVRNSLVALAEGPSRRTALPPTLLRSA